MKNLLKTCGKLICGEALAPVPLPARYNPFRPGKEGGVTHQGTSPESRRGSGGGDDLTFRLTVKGLRDAKALTFDRTLTWEWVEFPFNGLFENPSQAECTLTDGGTFTLTLPAVQSGNLVSAAVLLPGLSPSPGYDGSLRMFEPFFGAAPAARCQPDWIHCFIDNYHSACLMYADKAGTVKAGRKAPYDAKRTEKYDLVLEKGWNTIMAAYDPEAETVTYVTAMWPSPCSVRWMLDALT